MLKRGLWVWMSECSRISASTSVETTTHSTCSAAATIWAVRTGRAEGSWKYELTRWRKDLALPT